MAIRDDFTAGEVLAAADLNDTFASKVDYALPVNAQTGTTYTFVAADAEKLTTASNAAAVTLTIPPQSSVTWSDNTVLRVVNYGAGAVTIDGGSGVTVTNTSSTIAQYGAAVAIRTGSDAWTVVPFGGGDIPAATVSSPAATGQYTDTGITYDYYTFTGNGTLTVNASGVADVLVVGGGGGGGRNTPDGATGRAGGAGSVVHTGFYFEAGSHTVIIGAGGNTLGGTGNLSRIGSVIAAIGGGGGGNQGGNGQSGGSGGAGATPGIGLFAGNDGGGNSGGGAGAAGTSGNSAAGGAGISSSISGTSITYGGGGGAGGTAGGATATPGVGGVGGGGDGKVCESGDSQGNAFAFNVAAMNGDANTGGGGGASGTYFSPGNTNWGSGGKGGSGIVIVRVKV